MGQKTAARGRPKGTGLDDAGPLAAIADMIAANPGMKPTTAIKALGITDPSTVRRLRDKYQQRFAPRDRTPAERPSKTPIRPEVSNVISLRARSSEIRREAALMPSSPSTPPPSVTDKAEEATTASDEHPAQPAAALKPDLFAAAYAASLATAKTAIHLHYKSLWYAFHWSPYACAIRNAEFTRLVLSSLKDKDGDPRCSRPAD
jgi:hypothetical protein